jgi:hypothetical protein
MMYGASSRQKNRRVQATNLKMKYRDLERYDLDWLLFFELDFPVTVHLGRNSI